MNSVRATVILAIVFGTAGAAWAGENGPEKLLQALYAQHQPWQDKPMHFDDRKVLSKYFDAELTRLFLREEKCKEDTKEICNLDFDPIYCAQDYGESVRTVRFTKKADTPVTFEASFINIRETKVEVILARTRSGWRIADVTCPGSWSLKKMLGQPLPQ